MKIKSSEKTLASSYNLPTNLNIFPFFHPYYLEIKKKSSTFAPQFFSNNNKKRIRNDEQV